MKKAGINVAAGIAIDSVFNYTEPFGLSSKRLFL